MKNILSIDVESWIHFYIDALKKDRNYTSLERKELDNGYIYNAIKNLLDLLDKHSNKATFFVVAEIYDWYPEVIQEIAERGHEIGYHTHTHTIIRTRRLLEDQINQSKNFINKFRPRGFRAPQIFITKDALKCLKERDFVYSSSTYDDCGVKTIEGIDEIPVSVFSFRKNKGKNDVLPKNLTFKLLSKKIPFGSGLFISLFGSRAYYFIDYLNKQNLPAVLFIHPWQLYKHEKIKGRRFLFKLLSRNPLCLPYMRNILNIFENLMKKYKFTSFKEYYYGQQTILG